MRFVMSDDKEITPPETPETEDASPEQAAAPETEEKQPLSDEEKEQVKSLYKEGMKYFTQKDYLKAIEAWRKVLEIDPDNESVRRNLEDAEQRLKKLEPTGDE